MIFSDESDFLAPQHRDIDSQNPQVRSDLPPNCLKFREETALPAIYGSEVPHDIPDCLNRLLARFLRGF